MTELRIEDRELTKILYEQLDEYVVETIPHEKLEHVVYTFMSYIRENARDNYDILKLNDVTEWNKEKKILSHNGKIVNLTNKEKQVLSLLFQNINSDISYEQICMELWGEEVCRDRIKTLVKHVRKKLPKNTIKNVFDYGYRIEINY